MSKNEVIIREADEGDLSAIFDLVMDLAIFEKEPESVTVDVDYYIKSFREQLFEAHVAEVNNDIVGMILYYETYSTWRGKMLYLEDFIVKEEHRGKGIGQMLFDTFISISKEKECTMVKWQVLDWNQPAIDFYKKNKATIETNWYNGKIIY